MNTVHKYHLSGSCRNGKSCSFSHPRPVLRQKSSKKVPCRYFPQGKCAYGDKCPRSHEPVNGHSTKATSDGVSDGANQSADSNYSPVVGPLDSQSDHSDASSNHERDSPHQETQLKPSPPPPPQDTGNSSDDQERSQSLCIFYTQGLCQAGSSCIFLHSSPESKPEGTVNEKTGAPKESTGQQKWTISKHFQRGHCRLEDKCKHEHGLPNKAPVPTLNQSFGSDSPPASETHCPVLNDSQMDTSDTQMNTSVEPTDSPQEKWEDDRVNDEDRQPDDQWEHERDADVFDDQPPIESSQGGPLDTNMDEDQFPQWKSSSSNIGQPSPNIWQGLQQMDDQAREASPPCSPYHTGKREGPGSYYGDGWSEEEVGSPQWPIPSTTNVQSIPAPQVYPHISEIKPHWSQFADPLADPTIPFCKPHAQGQCAQGESCRFRHSLTPQEYTLLFLDQQPNLWTLRRTAPPNGVDITFQQPIHYFVAPTPAIQQPAIISKILRHPSTNPHQQCLFYSRGKCQNGTNCPFQHTGPPPGIPTTGSNPENRSNERSYAHKPKVCKYFTSGNCNNGSSCKFLHEGNPDNGKEPLEPNPSSDPPNGQPEEAGKWGTPWDENNDNAADWDSKPVEDSGWGGPVDYSGWGIDNEANIQPKKPICHQFANHGTCRFNNNCKFSHDVEPTPSIVEEKKADSGWINNDGDYVPPDTTPDSPTLPCPHFFKGHCKDEETCNFSHDLKDRPPDVGQQLDDATEYQGNGERPHTPEQPIEPEEEGSGWNTPWPVHEPETRQGNFKVNVPCRRFGQGYCQFGDDCRYMHISDTNGDRMEPEADIIDEGSSFIADGPVESTQVASTELPTAPVNENLTNRTETDTTTEHRIPAAEELEPITFEHPIVNRLLMNCDVTVGEDSTPSQIITTSDCNKILLTELPHDVDLQGIRILCAKYGQVTNITNIDVNQDPSIIQVEFAEASQTIHAAKVLDGHIYEGRKLTATLKARMPLTIRETNDTLVLKVTWPSPSLCAWSHYPTITKAKKEAARLNDITYRGRIIKATFVTPLRSQKDSFAIKIDRLPPDVTKSDLEKLCKENTLITINPPTYNEDASDAILSALDASRGLDTFDSLTGNNERTISIAFAVFKSESIAKSIMETVHSKPQGYLGNQPLTIRPTYYSRYRILRDQLDVIQNELDGLITKSDKQCTIQIDDHHDTSLVWIRMYAPLEIGPSLHAQLKDLVSGTVVEAEDGGDLWDDYFELPSSAKALKQLSNAFIHRDLRNKQLKVYGSKNEREDAQKSILKLLSKVRSQRHEIELPRQKLHPIINGTLAILKTDVGLNKISLDVFESKLIVRGTPSDVSKAIAILDSLYPTPGPFSSFGSCQICLHNPADAVTLSCHHRYCTSCLQFALHQVGRAPVRCISQHTTFDGHTNQCSAYVPYVIIRDILPTNAEADFLLSSFLYHVRSNPNELFCCPALNCQATYRRSGEMGVNLKCKFCLSDVCTFCKSFAHLGVSCEATKVN